MRRWKEEEEGEGEEERREGKEEEKEEEGEEREEKEGKEAVVSGSGVGKKQGRPQRSPFPALEPSGAPRGPWPRDPLFIQQIPGEPWVLGPPASLGGAPKRCFWPGWRKRKGGRRS